MYTSSCTYGHDLNMTHDESIDLPPRQGFLACIVLLSKRTTIIGIFIEASCNLGILKMFLGCKSREDGVEDSRRKEADRPKGQA